MRLVQFIKDQRRDDIVIALRNLHHDSVYNDNIYGIFKIYLRRATLPSYRSDNNVYLDNKFLLKWV